MSAKIIEGSYGCIYYPGLTCKLEKSKKKKIISKIQINDITSKNEIEIGKILEKEKIKGLRGIKSSCVVKRNVSFKNVSNCSIIENGSELVKIDQEYIKGKSIKYFLKHKKSTDYYIECLKLLKKLNNLNICHFDIHEGNILYNTENNHSYIIDFGISIDMKKIKKNNNYEDYFFRYINHNYWCIDIIIMNYVINMKKTIKNKNEAKKIVKMFMRSDFFTNCSNNFKKLYSDECLKYVSLFIDKSIPYVKNNLIKNWKTWDIFSLSILFIEFQNLLNDKNKGFIEILFECIHPNPKKRLNYDELLKKLKNI